LLIGFQVTDTFYLLMKLLFQD